MNMFKTSLKQNKIILITIIDNTTFKKSIQKISIIYVLIYIVKKMEIIISPGIILLALL